MNKVMLSIVASLALCVAAAAQAGPGNSQGTQNSSPTMQNPNNPNQQPGMGQPSNYPDSSSQTSNQNGNMGNESGKSEKKMKGCVMTQGSQAMLETKKGKEIALTGQDVSAHNGHEVEVKGNWASGSMAQSSAGSSSGEKTFNVTDVKMISDTCKNSKGSSMGTGANGTNPSGSTGSSPSSNQPQ